MVEHWRAIPLLYVRPVKAVNVLLDHGSVAAALMLAALAILPYWTRAAAHPHMLPAFQFVVPISFLALGILLVVFIPVTIVIIAQWEGLGSNGVILRRDYMPMLATIATVWAAAYLPAALITWTVPAAIVAHAYFLVLATIAARVIMGTSFLRAAVAVAGAWTVSILVLIGSGIWSPLLYYLTSPWLLYMLYMSTRLDMSSLTRGLTSRQALKRSLEAAAINPRDADAHYQLGLIYAQRRSYEEAEARFRTAISIDPQFGEAHLELGRILAAQGRHQDALSHFRTAAQIDDKLALNEVWRELGGAMLKLGDTAGAIPALEKYTDRRPYDPEGLVYYGEALREAGRAAEARAMFERAIEAVKTMPPHRRGQLRKWARQAKSSL